jgi:hypothetical protein
MPPARHNQREGIESSCNRRHGHAGVVPEPLAIAGPSAPPEPACDVCGEVVNEEQDRPRVYLGAHRAACPKQHLLCSLGVLKAALAEGKDPACKSCGESPRAMFVSLFLQDRDTTAKERRHRMALWLLMAVLHTINVCVAPIHPSTFTQLHGALLLLVHPSRCLALALGLLQLWVIRSGTPSSPSFWLEVSLALLAYLTQERIQRKRRTLRLQKWVAAEMDRDDQAPGAEGLDDCDLCYSTLANPEEEAHSLLGPCLHNARIHSFCALRHLQACIRYGRALRCPSCAQPVTQEAEIVGLFSDQVRRRTRWLASLAVRSGENDWLSRFSDQAAPP